MRTINIIGLFLFISFCSHISSMALFYAIEEWLVGGDGSIDAAAFGLFGYFMIIGLKGLMSQIRTAISEMETV